MAGNARTRFSGENPAVGSVAGDSAAAANASPALSRAISIGSSKQTSPSQKGKKTVSAHKLAKEPLGFP